MKLTVLVDNNTIIDNYFMGEPALSFVLEVDNKKIIFDTGYSDLFLQNAKQMNMDLEDIDFIVLSHGHNDHIGGLKHLLNKNFSKKVELIAHPLVFNKKIYDDNEFIGSDVSEQQAKNIFSLKLSKNPYQITPNLTFLGEIPRLTNFESQTSIGNIILQEQTVPDYLYDDSALVYKKDGKLTIITGCSHSGIVNIVRYAKQLCNCNNISAIIGGFHLSGSNITLINETIKFLKNENIQTIYPCHCTDLSAKCKLAENFYIQEIGVGSQLYFNIHNQNKNDKQKVFI